MIDLKAAKESTPYQKARKLWDEEVARRFGGKSAGHVESLSRWLFVMEDLLDEIDRLREALTEERASQKSSYTIKQLRKINPYEAQIYCEEAHRELQEEGLLPKEEED